MGCFFASDILSVLQAKSAEGCRKSPRCSTKQRLCRTHPAPASAAKPVCLGRIRRRAPVGAASLLTWCRLLACVSWYGRYPNEHMTVGREVNTIKDEYLGLSIDVTGQSNQGQPGKWRWRQRGLVFCCRTIPPQRHALIDRGESLIRNSGTGLVCPNPLVTVPMVMIVCYWTHSDSDVLARHAVASNQRPTLASNLTRAVNGNKGIVFLCGSARLVHGDENVGLRPP